MKMLQYLPTEILVQIFGHLAPSDLLSASLACRKWREVAAIHIANKVTVVVIKDPRPAIEIFTKSVINYRHWLFKSVELKLQSSFLEFWDCFAEHITTLTLIEVEVVERDLTSLLTKCLSLQELNLGGLDQMFMTGYFLEHKQNSKPLSEVLKNIKRFHLTGSRYLSDAIFSRLTSSLNSLETLSLIDCQISYQSSIRKRFYPPDGSVTASDHVLTFKHILELLHRNMSTLKSLSFGQTGIDSDSLCELASLPNIHLESIELVGCRQLTKNGVQFLAQNQQCLTSIDLSLCQRVTDYAVIAIAENIPRLKSLNLCSCQSVTEVGIRTLAKLKYLEKLNISQLEIRKWESIHEALGKEKRPQLEWLNCAFLAIQWETVAALAETAPNLRHLDLTMCTYGVNDRSIQAICKSLVKLKKLYLSGCISVSDIGLSGHGPSVRDIPSPDVCGIYEFSLECLGLKHRNPYKVPLGLKAEQAIRKEGEVRRYLEQNVQQMEQPTAFSLTNISGLHTLNLSGCIRLTDLTLCHAFQFTELSSLNLSCCQQIGEEGLIQVMVNCRAIEELILDECPNTTDQVILVIAHRLRRIKTLGLQQCVLLTNDALDTLSNCRTLRYLDVSGCLHMTREQVLQVKRRIPHLLTFHFKNIQATSTFEDCEIEERITSKKKIPTPPPMLAKLMKKLIH